VPVPEEKTTKNRLHLDLRPDDRDAEVQRLLALGATRADVGQGEQSWVVLADPEGLAAYRPSWLGLISGDRQKARRFRWPGQTTSGRGGATSAGSRGWAM
jgi:hypothetical protein